MHEKSWKDMSAKNKVDAGTTLAQDPAAPFVDA
jgi:hypothetical protein